MERQTLALANSELGFETLISFERVQISRTFVTFVSTAFSEVGKEELTGSQKKGWGKLQPVRSSSSWAAEGTQWGIAECCRPEHSRLGKGT